MISRIGLQFPEKVQIDPQCSIHKELVIFETRLMNGHSFTHAELVKELGKDKYADHIQTLGQILNDIHVDAPKILKEMHHPDHIQAFVAGLVHNDRRDAAILTIAGLIRLIELAKEETSSRATQIILDNELRKLIVQQQFEAALAEVQGTVAVKTVHSSDSNGNLITIASLGLVTWKDIERFINSRLSVRHVPSHEKARSNWKNGCFGDALSISTGIAGLILHLIEHKRLSISLPFFSDESSDSDKMRHLLHEFSSISTCLSDTDKELIAQEFEMSLFKFVHDSILLWTNKIDLNEPVKGCLKKRKEALLNSSAFLLIQESRDSAPLLPSEHSQYYQLGKIVRRHLPVEWFKAMITPSREFIEQVQMEEGADSLSAQLATLDSRAVRSAFHNLLDAARALI